MRSGVNNKNQSLAKSTRHRNATAVAVYIASNTFNLPLSVIADGMSITFDRAVNALKLATSHVQSYQWYANMVKDYTDNVLRLLPPTAGIVFPHSKLQEP